MEVDKLFEKKFLENGPRSLGNLVMYASQICDPPPSIIPRILCLPGAWGVFVEYPLPLFFSTNGFYSLVHFPQLPIQIISLSGSLPFVYLSL